MSPGQRRQGAAPRGAPAAGHDPGGRRGGAPGDGGDGRIVVRVTPRGGADAIDGVGPDGELLVRVRAAPVEGGANRAVLRLLADAFGAPVTSLVLEAGEGSRSKRIRLPADAVARLHGTWPGVAVSAVGVARRPR